MCKINVVIVDDERSSREELKLALSAYEDFTIIGEAKNVDEAKTLITTMHPDLIFLDIQMPGQSGFDLLEQLSQVPQVIFVTAYDQYAIRAFDNNALDYLLKPFRTERFAQTIEKIRVKREEMKAKEQLSSQTKQIFLKDGEHAYFIQPLSVYRIASAENYSKVYFEDKKVVIKRSLHQWESRLDPAIFFRANRTELVNIRFIQQVKPTAGGRLELVLQNGTVVEVSMRQSVKFRNINRI
ncbi:two-component system LytT family response regulator [Chitinophaga dinghuensis]|uniref:Two-component system LytT family response regulator n=1 Tax=Chitinophaga dinghuensis TaxID=1539050 RepID=A0A327VJT3_9BACT|nr:response regulator [Chitinophaga dinghuensis]RAJ74974.1 two-component system LytT family response regulator [Chitinophaga dinghuensis]